MTYSRKQTRTVYAVLFAFLVNALVPSYAFSADENSPKEMLLCTSQGYKWVTVVDDSNTSSNQKGSQHCKLCLFPSKSDHIDYQWVGSHLNTKIANLAVISANSPKLLLKIQFAQLLAQGRAPPIAVI